MEWNPGAEEVNPVANWIVTPETATTPMVSLGTSSDRIFSPPHTQAYFVTLAKGLPQYRLGPYVGISYSEWEDTLLFPFGLNVSLAPQWDLLGMNDGRNSHLLLTYKLPTTNVSLMLIKMRHPGLSLGFSF
ncbi:MAG: hypothetical protein ACO1SV_18365 [Fimbriimonas sp.]